LDLVVRHPPVSRSCTEPSNSKEESINQR
jgi:hypothetical protein